MPTAPLPSTGADRGRGAAALLLLGTALTLAALGAPAPARAASHAQGEEVEVTGRVADADGRPLAGLEVRLFAYHSTASLRRLARVEGYESHLSTLTDAQGGFALRWPWHDFYDRFWVAAGLKLPAGGESDFHELTRVDVSRRMTEPGPVIVALELPRDAEVGSYVDFVSTLASEEQKRLFAQLGRPDRVDRLRLGQQEEVTWWYFRAGKAYRFRDGRLDLVIPFDPVTSD
jgi:hypothetical protein